MCNEKVIYLLQVNNNKKPYPQQLTKVNKVTTLFDVYVWIPLNYYFLNMRQNDVNNGTLIPSPLVNSTNKTWFIMLQQLYPVIIN